MAGSGFGTNDVGDPVQLCPSSPPQQVYWLEIEMMGEDDEPIPFTEYQVVTPGGKPIKGYLDNQGWARLDGLTDSGSCQISFPQLDKDVWSFVQSLPARGDVSSGGGSGGDSSSGGAVQSNASERGS
jgi:hypothetical protein